VNDDERLLSCVRPSGWRNPDPAHLYDLVVIGAGTAGLVCAAGAAGLGARVALVERHRLGGDCLNTGCVPSKSLLRAARAVRHARRAAGAGITAVPRADFASVMESVRARRADLAHHDSVERFAAMGVDVFLGDGRFADRHHVTVGASELRFRRAVIATGGRPTVTAVPGLASVPYLTSENVFELREQPRRLLIIGGGSVGCELAQAFALLGTEVTLVESAAQLLPREDTDAAAIVQRQLAADGARILTGTSLRRTTSDGERIKAETDAGESLQCDAVLVATGRSPNVESLNLSAAGVEATPKGIVVDDRLRTSNPHVFAAGDVCSRYQFTHAADAMARIVVQNALFHGRRRVSRLVIPWATYTDPEVAHVGIPAAEARDSAAAITVPLTEVDRAVIDDETDGFLRVHHRRGRLVAVTIVAPGAGELIGYAAMLMRRGGSLADFSNDVFPYPTVADMFRRAGDAYRRTQLTPRVRAVLKRYFAVSRRV
jgi:pyruvate/2-oxoglutarate dehydrogenase complex dihydrolipoamide dehydrogenase (E3) component